MNRKTKAAEKAARTKASEPTTPAEDTRPMWTRSTAEFKTEAEARQDVKRSAGGDDLIGAAAHTADAWRWLRL